MENHDREELVQILTKFSECGWELIDAPAKAWLAGDGNSQELIAAIVQQIKSAEAAAVNLIPCISGHWN